MVYYNWEALTFLKEDFDNIEFFDKFYFFDPFDQGKHPEYTGKLFPTTSFYFDCFRPSENPQNKILFIGSYAADRNNDIRAFCEAARSIGLEIDFRLASKKIEEEKAALGIPEVEFFSFEKRPLLSSKLRRSGQILRIGRFPQPQALRPLFADFRSDRFRQKTDYDQSDHRTLRFLSPEQYVLLEWKQPWRTQSLPDLAVRTACPRPKTQIQLQQLDQLRIWYWTEYPLSDYLKSIEKMWSI